MNATEIIEEHYLTNKINKMENWLKEMIAEEQALREQTLRIVVGYIVNTIKSKYLYKKGGWKEVRKHYQDSESFNHHFSINSYCIYRKLRENKEPINLPIESNMKLIESKVNELLGAKVVQYYIDGKNHSLKII